MAPVGGNAAGGTADGPGRPPYEQARDELTELVRRLEAGGLTLEESLRLWERGEELATICEEWLEGARARLAAALASTDKPGAEKSGAEKSGAEKSGADKHSRTPDAPF